MKRFAALILVLCAALPACTATSQDIRLEMLQIEGLSDDEVATDITALRARAEGLWGSLHKAKLTTHLTKKRIAEYFESEKDLSDFIAIYASLFRESHFWREYVSEFEVERVIIEQNGTLARVEIKLWGKIYAVFNHRIHEVQTWQKINGIWMMKPLSY